MQLASERTMYVLLQLPLGSQCLPAGGSGAREPQSDLKCDAHVAAGKSGYCECCHGGQVDFNCEHSAFTCSQVCDSKEMRAKCGTGASAGQPFDLSSVTKPSTSESPEITTVYAPVGDVDESPVVSALAAVRAGQLAAPTEHSQKPADFYLNHASQTDQNDECKAEAGANFGQAIDLKLGQESDTHVCTGGRLSSLTCAQHEHEQYLCKGAGFRFDPGHPTTRPLPREAGSQPATDEEKAWVSRG